MRTARLFASVILLLSVVLSAVGMSAGRTAHAATASLTLTPNAVLRSADHTLVVTGSDFTPGSLVSLQFDGSGIGTATTNGSGAFTTAVTVPSSSVGSHSVSATDASAVSANRSLNLVDLSVSSSSAPPGSPVTISGEGFLPNQPLTVQLGGITVLTGVTAASGDFANLSLVVPSSLSGPQVLTIHNGSPATLTISTAFTVGQATLLLQPNAIIAGSAVQISGAGYASNAALTLKLDGVVLGALTTNIAGQFGPTAFPVPAGVANGPHTIGAFSGTGQMLARSTLIVHVPAAMLVISPNTGVPGTTVTVIGAGFHPGETVVFALNGAAMASAIANAQGQIRTGFVLPANLPAGNMELRAIGQSSNRTAVLTLAVASPARVIVHDSSVQAGRQRTISGVSFAPHELVRLSIPGHILTTVQADGQGSFTTTVTIPITAPAASVLLNAVGQQSQRAAAAALTITAIPAGITISAGTVLTHATFTVDGCGFHPGEQVLISVPGHALTTATANGQGAFTGVPVTLPASIAPGTMMVTASGQNSQKTASASLSVQARVGSLSIAPDAFTPGTQVRIEGAGFAPREQVALAVNGVSFATVPAGSDGSFVFSHTLPVTLATGSVRITAGGVAGQALATVSARIIAPAPVTLGSTSWYFAGGRTDGGYTEQIVVLNPHDRSVQGTITFNYGAKSSSVHRFELRPQARGTYDVSRLVGNVGRVAGVVHADLPVVVARTTLRGNAEIMPAGAVTAPSRTWYMAEGYTGLTFQEELDLFNPTDQAANVRVTWPLFNGKPAVTYQLTLAPHTQQPIPVNAHVDRASHATLVTADQPIVAGRTMRFGTQQQGAFTTVGATSTGTTLYFAEGSTNNGFEQYMTILNPDSGKAARVTTSFFDRQGNSLGSRTLVVEPMSRATIKVHDVTRNTAIATVVQSSSPIVAERSMYFGAPNSGAAGGTVVFGQATPALGWSFASGDTRPGNSQFELLFNPNRSSSTIEAAYYTDDGQMVRKTFTLPGNARLNIDVTQAVPELPRGYHGVVLHSTNGVPFIAEQAIYGMGMTSGGATIGTPMT